MRVKKNPQFWITAALVAIAGLYVIYILAWSPETPTAESGAPPEAVADEVRLAAPGMPITFDVTSNDRDPDSDLDPLSIAVSTPPVNGGTTVTLDGSIVYTPGPGYAGEDRFGYQICDSAGRCDEADVVVTDREVRDTGQTVRFAVFGDYGDSEAVGSAAVAELVSGLDPDFIVTTGDNSYDSADYDGNVGQFYGRYIGSYNGALDTGSEFNRFFPSLGDHEYSDGGIEAYLDYFTLPGEGVSSSLTSGNERYYDFVMGPVHVFVLNVQPEEPDGTTQSSPQAEWLRSQLLASSSPWRVVVSPVPPFSSGDNHGSEPRVQWPFAQWGADVVFSGDDHVYERISSDSIAYFVSGLGGRSIYGFDEVVEGSEYRYNDDFGVVMVEACDDRIAISFHSLSEGVVDQFELGAATCPADRTLS